MKKIILAILGLSVLPAFGGGCSILKGSYKAEVAVVDADLTPITKAEVRTKQKLTGEYVIVPREVFNAQPEATTTTPTAARPGATARKPAKAATPRPTAVDNRLQVSWDGRDRIQLRGPQKFAVAEVFPGRGGDWRKLTPDMTAEGFIDPAVVGPLVEKVRQRNQQRLAAAEKEGRTLSINQLEKVCFNFRNPVGDRRAEHCTDNGWCLITPDAVRAGGRILLDTDEGSPVYDATEETPSGPAMAFCIVPY